MKKTIQYLTIIVLLAATQSVRAHCQVPCGIYDDQMRIHMMEEHVTTMAKAMKQIEAGSNQHQTVRWVMNKEKHAEQLSEIVTYYFMAQRIKPGCENYALKLSQLHEILVYTMKAKQSTDAAHITKLQDLIHHFEHSYIGGEHKH